MAAFIWLRRCRWFMKRQVKSILTLSVVIVFLFKSNSSSKSIDGSVRPSHSRTSPSAVSDAVQRPSTVQWKISTADPERKVLEDLQDDRHLYVSEILSENVKETLGILDKQIEVDKKKIPELKWDTENRRLILIVSSWRTGSSFFGHVLAQYPAIFHVHEPLMYVGVRQIRNVTEDETLAKEAIRNLRDLLLCRYRLEYTKHFYEDNGTLDYVTSHNLHVTRACSKASDPYTCRDATYMQQACRRFPIHMAKIVRIRLSLLEPLLADPVFRNLKIAYLIRDPRATMNSRFRTGNDSWCWDVPDCMEPAQLCSDMNEDVVALQNLAAKYKDRLMLLRYETMAVNPQNYFQRVYKFLGIKMPHFVKDVIRELTTESNADAYGVVQRPEERLKAWRKELTPTQINDINQKCAPVIQRLGYLA